MCFTFQDSITAAMMRRPGLGPSPVPVPPGKVSNVTNSNDPAAKESRVFVGNLNTFVLSKEDVDAIFHRYGVVTGISMHKGYAFVQFNHPAEARRAVAFENGQLYAGQPLGQFHLILGFCFVYIFSFLPPVLLFTRAAHCNLLLLLLLLVVIILELMPTLKNCSNILACIMMCHPSV